VIWVNNQLPTRIWTAIDIPNTNNLTAIQLTGNYRRLSIFNFYNPWTSREVLNLFSKYLTDNRQNICSADNNYML
ncbi:hypothetical protein BDQ12DRAFT_611379, partial [Crucibulum laeve]